MQCIVQSNPITRICNSSSSSFPPVTKIRITFPIMGKLENPKERFPHKNFLPQNYTKTKKSKSKELILLSHPLCAKWSMELLLELKVVEAHYTFFHSPEIVELRISLRKVRAVGRNVRDLVLRNISRWKIRPKRISATLLCQKEAALSGSLFPIIGFTKLSFIKKRTQSFILWMSLKILLKINTTRLEITQKYCWDNFLSYLRHSKG